MGKTWNVPASWADANDESSNSKSRDRIEFFVLCKAASQSRCGRKGIGMINKIVSNRASVFLWLSRRQLVPGRRR